MYQRLWNFLPWIIIIKPNFSKTLFQKLNCNIFCSKPPDYLSNKVTAVLIYVQENELTSFIKWLSNWIDYPIHNLWWLRIDYGVFSEFDYQKLIASTNSGFGGRFDGELGALGQCVARHRQAGTGTTLLARGGRCSEQTRPKLHWERMRVFRTVYEKSMHNYAALLVS